MSDLVLTLKKNNPATVHSRLGRGSTSQYSFYVCPSGTVQPLTDLSNAPARAAFNSEIDAMTAGGGTAGHIGAAWGWYLLSPQWTSVFGFQAGLGYSPNVKKIVILLTDGGFNMAYNNGGLGLAGSGMAAAGPTDANNPLVVGSSPYQALQLCNNMKSAAPSGQAITIYTIGLLVAPDPVAEALLQSCSGASNYYPANSASSLTATFADIAKKLTNLRVSS